MQAWRERDGVRYYIVNEKFSSQDDADPEVAVVVLLSKEQPGYVGDRQIIDENTAVSPIQIPGMGGRDLTDYMFYVQDGKEYMKMSNILLINEKGVGELPIVERAEYTIGPDGHAMWFRITDAGDDKEIIVDMPEERSFAVYAEGQCIGLSCITGHREARLPNEGMIAFVGAVGTVFDVRIETVE